MVLLFFFSFIAACVDSLVNFAQNISGILDGPDVLMLIKICLRMFKNVVLIE